jgi:uncharacterized protein (UPF0248 family)
MSRDRKLTGREAFNRLFWDVRLDRGVFVIGCADRHAEGGLTEVPLLDWQPDGSIPWHRIAYIRCGPTLVWSRDQEVDRLASDDLPTEAWAVPSAEGQP